MNLHDQLSSMYNQILLFVWIMMLSMVTTNGLIIKVNEQSNNIHLEPPNLSGNFRDNRPPFHLFENTNARQIANQGTIDPFGVYPCNGTYLKTNGTTCGLREIMIGRCYEYQYVKRGLYLSDTTAIKNCTELYELFESAARHKSFCSMNMSTYEQYFARALDGVHVINRAMFWSGTYAIAHTYSGNGYNYITLEDTLAAAMANGLSWCGLANDTEGFDYISCPNNCKDNIWADMAFWGLASQTFAQKVAGEVYVILNGSRTDGRPSFRNGSYFTTFELPNMQRNGSYRVTKINALLLHSPDHTVMERCGEKSVLIMENLIRSYGFDYSCQDDPDELILIMCGDAWNARECQIAKGVLRKEWNKKLFGISSANSHFLSFVLFFSLIFISQSI